ncbi:MAG: class I SAM-dependent methyltransferase [Porphyromonas sp.]|nr:class I SAM-dependent methyltransferase [Porphyromonas sp.]
MSTSQTLEDYILAHTSPEPELRRQLARAAHVRLIRPRMLSGHLQGNVLRMLVALSNARQVLEIGTYSGYAAHAMAEALPEGGKVHTIEYDDEMEDFIRLHLSKASYRDKIELHIGDAMELIPQLVTAHSFDIVYMDANKRQYPDYYQMLIPHLRSGALIIADNTLWDGKVVESVRESDVQTQAILRFNQMVQDDPRVDNLILPMRDGLSIIRVL